MSVFRKKDEGVLMGEDFADTPDHLRKRIDAIIKEKPSHKEVLEFLKGVMTEQYHVRTSIKTAPVRINEVKTNGMMEGYPLLNKKELSLDIRSATKIFRRLCGLLSRSKKTSADTKRVTQALHDNEINLEELFKHAATEDLEYVSALSKKLKVKEDVLSFLAGNSIKPIFEAYAHELKGYVNQETWWRSYCPICGSLPFIAEIGGEGERFLICSLCGFEWRFRRLKCPFCENEDHKGLRYFYTEKEGSTNRVDVCEKCKNYIKTLDTRELRVEVSPLVEDVGTLYLDVLAQKEGYTRGGNFFWKGNMMNKVEPDQNAHGLNSH